MERIDDAVRRVVRVKRLLLEREQAEADGGMAALNVNACVGCAAHRAIARRAASQSAVLLINKDGLLPLKSTPAPERGSAGAAGAAVIVTGAGANDSRRSVRRLVRRMAGHAWQCVDRRRHHALGSHPRGSGRRRRTPHGMHPKRLPRSGPRWGIRQRP